MQADERRPDWRVEVNRKLQVADMNLRTRESCLQGVRRIVDHFGKPPREIGGVELEDSRRRNRAARLRAAGLWAVGNAANPTA